MAAHRFVVHLAPVAKGRPRVVLRHGKPHAYTPTETAANEFAIRRSVETQLPDGWQILRGALRVEVWAYLPVPKTMPKRDHLRALPTVRPDADNFAKMLDALNDLVWVDDAQVVTMTVHKRYAWTEGPRWDIRVETMPEPEVGAA